jgi:hypothetical protein
VGRYTDPVSSLVKICTPCCRPFQSSILSVHCRPWLYFEPLKLNFDVNADFPRSLCFMWFWFGLEILRLVYKKAFKKIIERFLSYCIWAFNFQKNSTVPYNSWKKVSSKLGAKGIKRSGILRWFQKCVEFLRQEVPKYLFSEKQFFAKLSKSLKIQFFCKNFFEISAKFGFFWYPVRPILKKFFSNYYKGRSYFFRRSNKIETAQYFKKRFFIN